MKKKNVSNSLVLVQDLIDHLAAAASDIQRELDHYHLKETVRVKRILEESDLSLEDWHIEMLLPDFIKLESFKVETNIDVRTIKEHGAQISASVFGRVTNTFFEARYSQYQKNNHRLSIEVEPSFDRPSKLKHNKEKKNG